MNKVLYHYTNLHTLCAIASGIKSGMMYLRAGNAENMNDPNDCYYFVNMLGELTGADKSQILQISEEKKKYDRPYLVSLSKNRDDLHMWNCYGDDGCGVAIGIRNIEKIAYDFFKSNHISTHLFKCLYMDAKKVKKNNVLWDIIKNNDSFGKDFWMKKEISNVSNIIKHPCYRYEKEYRIVIMHGEKEFVINGNTLYHPSEDAFYINVPLSEVKEIIVGPCANYESIKKIYSSFFPDTIFNKSIIPYRKK